MNYHSGPSHFGDCAWAIIALRKIPGEHHFYVPTEYHWQLHECVEGASITIHPHEEAPPDSKCSWIGSQRFAHRGVTWRLQPDVVAFLMQWSNCMCEENGIPHQFLKREDMLADFPAINRPVDDVPEFDALVINCPPKSGQCPRWDQGEMDTLIQELGEHHRVIVTNPTTATNVTEINKTVCQIGALSLRAKFVVAVASGAHWGIHNVWRKDVPTFLFLDDPLYLDYGREMPRHGLVSGMRQELAARGYFSKPAHSIRRNSVIVQCNGFETEFLSATANFCAICGAKNDQTIWSYHTEGSDCCFCTKCGGEVVIESITTNEKCPLYDLPVKQLVCRTDE